jgi:hypothetical protein
MLMSVLIKTEEVGSFGYDVNLLIKIINYIIAISLTNLNTIKSK